MNKREVKVELTLTMVEEPEDRMDDADIEDAIREMLDGQDIPDCAHIDIKVNSGLSELQTHLLIEAAHYLHLGANGGYTKDALVYVMEQLTQEDIEIFEPFLEWCKSEGKTFGHGNIVQVFAQFQNEVKR